MSRRDEKRKKTKRANGWLDETPEEEAESAPEEVVEERPESLSKVDLVRLLNSIAPPIFSGKPEALFDFMEGVDRLVRQGLCGTDADLLFVVSHSLRGDAGVFFGQWMNSAPEGGAWRSLRGDLCRRFLGHSFKMQAVRDLLSVHERHGDLVSFVQSFRRVHDKLRLAEYNLPDSFMQALFVAKLGEEHARMVVVNEEDSLEETLIAAERHGAHLQQPRVRPPPNGHIAQGFGSGMGSMMSQLRQQRPTEETRGAAVAAGTASSAPSAQQPAGTPFKKSRQWDMSEVTCHNCQKKGHMKRECPERAGPSSS